MLTIDRAEFAHAVEALLIACRTAKDEAGLLVHADIPMDGPGRLSSGAPVYDKRVEAITLGAIVALVNGPARVADEAKSMDSDFAREGYRRLLSERGRLGPGHGPTCECPDCWAELNR